MTRIGYQPVAKISRITLSWSDTDSMIRSLFDGRIRAIVFNGPSINNHGRLNSRNSRHSFHLSPMKATDL